MRGGLLGDAFVKHRVRSAGRALGALLASSVLLGALLASGALLGMPLVSSARADDTADEADAEFSLGAMRYERGDYTGALTHFLASNRLAQNHNVLFNIALCYERLGRLPEAYRYYARSLEGEPDEAVRVFLRSALTRLGRRVALLHVETSPPHARLYVDRRDLGERGAAPQTIALLPGVYRVFAELEGYRLAESPPVELRVGTETQVSLELQRIVGTLRVSGPAGASVHLDADDAPESCQAPCDLQAPPGQHTLIVSKAGYRTARVPVSVLADQISTLPIDLDPESGSLLLKADEVGAMIEIDGLLRGVIPASFDLPVGSHQVRVVAQGFQPIERRVEIQANRTNALDLKLTSIDVVEAASRQEEPIEQAPASISLITSQELRTMRYPTLSEALRGTRGVSLTDDRAYTTIGVRGLAEPGSYGKRVLVTLDGMPTNEAWTWSSFDGFDLRTDLEDIDRIEVVRGPGSVVYGTGAFMGVINLVTRGRDVPSGVEAGASVASDGVFRARARLTRQWSSSSGFWASVSGGVSEGRDFFFAEYLADGPPEIDGNARGLDGARFATLTGRGWWRDLTVSWSLNHYLKYLPTGQYEAIFGDGRSRQSDTRGFVEARFEPHIGKSLTSLTRVHANLYAYRSQTPLAPDDGGLDQSRFDSYWFGAEQRFVLSPSPVWRASLGSEVQGFPTAHAREWAEHADRYDDNAQLLVAAVYANLDAYPMPALKLTAGARFDYYSTSGGALNPRIALITQPYAGGNLKLLFGTAFIAPSISESRYAYYDLEDNPNLRAEHLYSAELEWTHRLSPLLVATASAYTNYVTDLITLETLPADASGLVLNQYRNAGTPVGTLGAEAELRREWSSGWMLGGSYSLQRSVYLRSPRLADLLGLERSGEFRELPNVPRHMASFRAAAPLWPRLLSAMARVTFETGRYDRNSRAGDPDQTVTQWSLVVDCVLTGREERLGFDYSLGVYNALDSDARQPVSSEFRQLSIPISGRSLLAAATVSF
jgi:outer membrane receptor protein involved in Fe transport